MAHHRQFVSLAGRDVRDGTSGSQQLQQAMDVRLFSSKNPEKE